MLLSHMIDLLKSLAEPSRCCYGSGEWCGHPTRRGSAVFTQKKVTEEEVQEHPTPDAVAEITEVINFCEDDEPTDDATFQVHLRPHSEGLGVELEICGGALLVAKVRHGAAKEWNESCTHRPRLLLRPGDRILEVNGKEGSCDLLLQEMRRAEHVTLVLKHAKTSQVKIVKDHRELGFTLLSGADQMDQLRVKSLRKGVIDEWNTANPCQAIEPGDRIVWVNGICVRPAAMLQELQEQDILDITVIRPV